MKVEVAVWLGGKSQVGGDIGHQMFRDAVLVITKEFEGDGFVVFKDLLGDRQGDTVTWDQSQEIFLARVELCKSRAR